MQREWQNLAQVLFPYTRFPPSTFSLPKYLLSAPSVNCGVAQKGHKGRVSHAGLAGKPREMKETEAPVGWDGSQLAALPPPRLCPALSITPFLGLFPAPHHAGLSWPPRTLLARVEQHPQSVRTTRSSPVSCPHSPGRPLIQISRNGVSPARFTQ